MSERQLTIPNITSVIAIQNYGCSGTTLMHSLLDDHPQVISMPLLMAMDLYQVWDKIEDPSDLPKIAALIFTEKPGIFNAFHEKNDPSLRMLGDEKNLAIQISPEQFFSYFVLYINAFSKMGKEISRKDFMCSFYLAYHACWNREFTGNIILYFPIHSQEKRYAELLLKDFKKVFFLHMIREPLQNLGSLMKHINHEQMPISINKSLLDCGVSQIFNETSKHW